MPHVCPWWVSYFHNIPLRRLVHDPQKMLAPHVREGMIVVDIGSGAGYFSIPMAAMVGESGLVIAADIQAKALDLLARRARKAGLIGRLRLHQCQPGKVGLETPVDFVLLANVVHETPDPQAFLQEVCAMLKAGGQCYLTEPVMRVSASQFQETVKRAERAGLTVAARPRVPLSRTVLLSKVVSRKEDHLQIDKGH
jgi:ubiquinone/menaquinone biosynthesis C-methylase UbiE